MVINHSCCIKLVPLVIFVKDARSHIHHNILDKHNYNSHCGLGYSNKYSHFLRAERSGDRIPLRADIFRILPDLLWGKPASCTMDARLFQGGKWPGLSFDHPLPSSVWVFIACSKMNFTFYLSFYFHFFRLYFLEMSQFRNMAFRGP